MTKLFTPPGSGFGAACLAAGCFSGGVFLALSHPLAQPWAPAGFLAATLAAGRWPGLWVLWLPLLLPLLNLAPWSGWLMFEEFDLLVLAAAAGGYGGRILPWRPRPAGDDRERRLPRWPILLAAWVVLVMGRGFADAGGFEFGWFQGYTDSLNSLRAAKGPLFALLLLPLLEEELRRDEGKTLRRLAAGLAGGLGIVAAAVLWERAAFPGLLDFSSRYRTTAFFWEMHVGGAALDGYLGLTLPFALRALLTASRPAAWTGAAALALLAGYACLTTFSRGVYLAALAALGLAGLLILAARPAGRLGEGARAALNGLAGLVLALAAATGAFCLGSYAGAMSLLAALGGALHFGGRAGIRGFPVGWRKQGGILVAAALAVEVAAVANGGSFMMGRLQASEGDLGSRFEHWREGLQVLRTPVDWLLGKGLGRYPASYWAAVSDAGDTPAAYRPALEGGNRYLTLLGLTEGGDGAGVFRLSQRVGGNAGSAPVVVLDVRAAAAADLRFRLCERHLLYEGACLGGRLRAEKGDGSWRRAAIPLAGEALGRAPWHLPRPAFFSIDLTGLGQQADIDNVALLGSDGRDLLANGDFSRETARWFPIVRHRFQPWHIDNVFLEVLLDQGILGLGLFLGLLLSILGRVRSGGFRRHPFMPYLLAALGGFFAVGLFGSLLDVPRVAFLFYFLLGLAFLLSRPSGQGRGPA